MHCIRLIAAALLLGVASCAGTPGVMMAGGSPLIDVPVAPFPYNSLICP